MIEKSVARIDLGFVDLLRRFARHLLDVDSSRRAHHEDRTLTGSVHDDPDIGFVLDIDRRCDQHLPHLEPLDVHAQDRARGLPRAGRIRGEFHASRLAATADVDLGLHDDRAPQIARGGLGCRRIVRHPLGRHREAMVAEDLPRLVLVDLHVVLSMAGMGAARPCRELLSEVAA